MKRLYQTHNSENLLILTVLNRCVPQPPTQPLKNIRQENADLFVHQSYDDDAGLTMIYCLHLLYNRALKLLAIFLEFHKSREYCLYDFPTCECNSIVFPICFALVNRRKLY